MDFLYKNVLIFGYSKSGKACEKVLKQLNVNYKILDDNLKIDGGKFVLNVNKHNITNFDLIIISPGISINNKIVLLAEKFKIKVMGELEFAYLYCCNAKIIAITGTNGKTTTTKLITHILKLANYNCECYGNVGVPLSESFNKQLDYVVVEVSSFQLESINKFKPFVGVILNIDSDHLDRHKTLKNYVNLKLSMLKNCGNDVNVVLSGEDKNLIKNNNKIYAKKHFFVTNYILAKQIKKYRKNDVYSILNNSIINVETNEKIITIKNNIENVGAVHDILASVIVCVIIGIDYNFIENGVNSFKMLEHRVEYVGKINNIKFYNDSKATNIHAMQNSLKCFNKNVILLMGGFDKFLNFSNFCENLPCNIKQIVLFGQCKNRVNKTFKKYKISNVKVCDKLEKAIEVAYSLAESEDVILLSPACSSFDEFESYEKRGDYFKEKFNMLKANFEKVNYDKKK